MPAQIVDGELVLTGYVGESYWMDGFTSIEVIQCLAQIGPDADVTVRLNSGGGYVDDGIAIYNALKAHKGKVTMMVDGVAASSASVIAMAGAERVMRLGALMMVHDPSTLAYGTVEDFRRAINGLEAFAGSLVSIYADRTGESPETTRETMKAETWLDAAAAVNRGFATGSDATDAKPAAAFDYRIYAHAPAPLKAVAAEKGWSLRAAGNRPRASAPVNPGQTTELSMTDKTPASGPAAADIDKAVADAQARIKAIMTHDEAKGREDLAAYFAYDTRMGLDDAVKALAKAPKAEAAPTGSAPGGTDADHARYEAERRQPATGLANPGGGKPTAGKPKWGDVLADAGLARAARH